MKKIALVLMIAAAGIAHAAAAPQGMVGAIPSPLKTGSTEAGDLEQKSSWYQRHAEGWFWRDVDPEVEETDTEEPEETTSASPAISPNTLYPPLDQPITDPLARLKALQQAVETSKALMVLQPTPENIRNWVQVQDQVLRKSSLLADNWQRLMWQNPQYDYSQVRPTSPAALETYSAEYKATRRAALREIAREYGLYFVIAESCPYCHAMAPYLKRFADSYGFTVITVTIDGGTVPEFPDAMYSPEFAEKLDVKITPAIILARPSEGVIEPVAYGFINLDELEKRIYRLFRQEPGSPTFQVQPSTQGTPVSMQLKP